MLRRGSCFLVFVLAFLLAVHAAAQAQSGGDFSAIAGTWEAHGFSVDIGSDGQAVANWRVYTWCSDLTAPGPCDSMVDNTIVDGGKAMLQFTALSSSAATARVLTSTDPSLLVAGSTVRLQLMPGGVATLLPDRGGPLLCGPNFDPSAFASSPCGA